MIKHRMTDSFQRWVLYILLENMEIYVIISENCGKDEQFMDTGSEVEHPVTQVSNLQEQKK